MAEKTRPALSFTLVCDDVRQEMGGKVSLMGIFESIFATQFPALQPRIAIMNEWTEGVGEFETVLRILSPDRKTVLRETRGRFKLTDARFRHRDISIHLNMEFKEPGTYWIENAIDGVLVNSVPLQVTRVKDQPFH
jgi:hypothetical protein